MVNKYQVASVIFDPQKDFNVIKNVLKDITSLNVNNFRKEGSSHKPDTSVKLAYCSSGLLGQFTVSDNFIICKNNKYNSMVCKDSCVELFVKPKRDSGYFNFEFNCGGAIHSSYIVDPTRTEEGFKEFYKVSEDIGSQIKVKHSLPEIINSEITQSTDWTLEFYIPFSIMESYIGSIKCIHGTQWQGNFYKCADGSSHPHWGSWNPVSELNFHAPEDFGILIF